MLYQHLGWDVYYYIDSVTEVIVNSVPLPMFTGHIPNFSNQIRFTPLHPNFAFELDQIKHYILKTALMYNIEYSHFSCQTSSILQTGETIFKGYRNEVRLGY